MREITWTQMKTFLTRGCRLQCVDLDERYWLAAWDGPFAVECLIHKTAETDQAALTEFVASYLPATNKVIEPMNAVGHVVMEQGIRRGVPGTKAMSLVTHDFGDRTSWFQKSLQVIDETLTTADALVFSSLNPWWINFTGQTSKLTYQYKTVTVRSPTVSANYGKHTDWTVVVKVNDLVVAAGFTIDYVTGTITFATAQTGNTVKATYWHNSGVSMPSEFLIVPPPGTKYTIEHVEMQFSATTQITAPIRFEVWASPACTTDVTLTNGKAAKQVNVAGYSHAQLGPFPDAFFDGGMGQLRADYRNTRDLINAANEGKGTIPPLHLLPIETLVMPFNYVQAFTLDSKYGAVFRLRTLGDVPFASADLATATFYLIIEPS